MKLILREGQVGTSNHPPVPISQSEGWQQRTMSLPFLELSCALCPLPAEAPEPAARALGRLLSRGSGSSFCAPHGHSSPFCPHHFAGSGGGFEFAGWG